MKQLLILEGPDCAGKTYLGQRLAGFLGSVYFHCDYTEPLGHAMMDYQTNVLNNALNGILNRQQIWIIDRLWPSEVVYSKILRPDMHPMALLIGEKLHMLATSVDVLYVYCCDSEVENRHTLMPDSSHHYTHDQFKAIVNAYDSWANGMHEDFIANYNMQVHGDDIHGWAKSLNIA